MMIKSPCGRPIHGEGMNVSRVLLLYRMPLGIRLVSRTLHSSALARDSRSFSIPVFCAPFNKAVARPCCLALHPLSGYSYLSMCAIRARDSTQQYGSSYLYSYLYPITFACLCVCSGAPAGRQQR